MDNYLLINPIAVRVTWTGVFKAMKRNVLYASNLRHIVEEYGTNDGESAKLAFPVPRLQWKNNNIGD
jgi:hypothetical protein